MWLPHEKRQVIRPRRDIRVQRANSSPMFTGIIEQLGRVQASNPNSTGRRLAIDPQGWTYRANVGDSVSVNGCCLTVATEPVGEGGLLVFDVIPETLRKTTIGELKVGTRVNLEHAATPTTLLGGHVVQGHVDGVGEVLEIAQNIGSGVDGVGSDWRVRLTLPMNLWIYVVPKGSIALDGVSLTIAELYPGDAPLTAAQRTGRAAIPRWLEVALIPTTLAKTTLGDLGVGSRVNVECDVMGKTIVRYMRTMRVGDLGKPG